MHVWYEVCRLTLTVLQHYGVKYEQVQFLQKFSIYNLNENDGGFC